MRLNGEHAQVTESVTGSSWTTTTWCLERPAY
jgi:hypothetical protein